MRSALRRFFRPRLLGMRRLSHIAIWQGNHVIAVRAAALYLERVLVALPLEGDHRPLVHGPRQKGLTDANDRITSVAGLILVLSSIYLIMLPWGWISPLASSWDPCRAPLLFPTLSVLGVAYGSLCRAAQSRERQHHGAAQMMAAYERLQDSGPCRAPRAVTDLARHEVA